MVNIYNQVIRLGLSLDVRVSVSISVTRQRLHSPLLKLSWCDQKETFVCGQKENNEVGTGLEIASGSRGFKFKVLQRRIGLCGDAT
jgi:hypothetical protein